jgi:alginate O-acetyltransferase complex protein AlgI
MVFSSVVFLFGFLPLTLLVYFLLPSLRLRNVLLIGASLIFYLWGEKLFVAVLLLSVVMNHGLGLAAARTRGSVRGRWVVGAAIVGNLALLGAFKYANFFADNLNALAGRPLVEIGPIHLPLGISFFTFQALTYVVDVARGDATVQRRLRDVALYVSMFPQLVAGPIVRYRSVASQLARRQSTLAGFALGVRRFTVGLGKKLLIADSLAIPADEIFALPATELTAPLAWLGLVCFSLQLYFDFSGYSDMAIGLGRMFGFRFPENFRYPYVSQSVREFWRRWHITLSSWFRDYVYIPLGGNRLGPLRTYVNLVGVFLLCGMWHGASWNFAIWGLHHGAFLALERTAFGRALAVVWAPLRHAYTLLAVVTGWVWFRAESLPEALGFFRALAGGGTAAADPFVFGRALQIEVLVCLALGILASGPLLRSLNLVWLGLERRVADERAAWIGRARHAASVVWTFAILLTAAATVAASSHIPFLYFRF